MDIELNVGSIRVNVNLGNVMGYSDDYFLDKFENEIKNPNGDARIVEWSTMGLAFDCDLTLEYNDMNDLIKHLDSDLKAIRKVLLRNKKRLLMRTNKNERIIMNITCTIGGICDDWVYGKKD